MDRRGFLVGAAALAVAPRAFAYRLGGTPTALVTADTEAHVAAVELATGKIVKRIATLAGPRSIESVFASRSVVAHTTEGAITLLDGLEKRRVLNGFEEPRYTATSTDGRLAYVTDSKRGDVAVVDLIVGRVVHRTEVGALARHVSADPLGRWLWVALGFSAPTIVVLDLADPLRPRVVRRIRPPFLAHDVAFEPKARRVWVSAGQEERLAVYGTNGDVIRTLHADAAPQHFTFSAGRAFVAEGECGMVRVHALHDARLLHELTVPVGSYNVQAGLGAVVTPSLGHGTLVVLDRFGRKLREVRVASSSHDAALVTTA
jgi:hypothetical protein